MRDTTTILLVEDDVKLLNSNRLLLESEGYRVLEAQLLADAWRHLLDASPDLIVLDIVLPDGSGLDFLAELRKTSRIPVLLLTSLGTPEDVVRGLRAGGDDYLPKPFDTGELVARIETMLRRAAYVPDVIEKGSLRLDLTSGQAFLFDTDMLLAQKEFALLLVFTQNEGRVMSAEYLYEKVWGRPMIGNDSAVKNMIYRLRKKLLEGGMDIKFQRNEGYVFVRAQDE